MQFKIGLLCCALLLGSMASFPAVGAITTFTPADSDLRKGGLARTYRAVFELTIKGDDNGDVRFSVTQQDGIDDDLLDVVVDCNPGLPLGTRIKVTVAFKLKCTSDCRLMGAGVRSIVIRNQLTNQLLCVGAAQSVTNGTSDSEDDGHEVQIEDVNDDETGDEVMKVSCVRWAVRTTGSINAPGGGTLKYKVTARKVPGTTTGLQFWLDLSNEENVARTVIACAMVRLTRDAISMTQYEVQKEDQDGMEVWKCHQKSNVSRPPSYHLGCKKVTVPARTPSGRPGTKQAFDVTVDLAVPFLQSELGSVYWDLLQDCELTPSCDIIKAGGANLNLSPGLGEIIENSANVWGGNWFGPESLESVAYNVAIAEAGNWVTMAFPDSYASRLVGSITNVPTDGQIVLDFPGMEPVSLTAPDTGVIDLDIPFLIPPEPDAVIAVSFTEPTIQPEGTVVRLAADIVADEDNSLYVAGALMHRLDLTFVRDTTQPLPPEVDVSCNLGRIQFDVTAADVDLTTMVAAASIRYSFDGGDEQVAPLDFANPAVDEDAGTTLFRRVIISEGEVMDWTVVVADELGNESETSGSLTCEPPEGFPAFSDVGLVLLAVFLAIGVGRSSATNGAA